MPRILGSSKKTLMFYLLGQVALTSTVQAANEEIVCNNNSYYLSRVSHTDFGGTVSISSGKADSVNVNANTNISAINFIQANNSPLAEFYILGDGLVFYGPGIFNDYNFDAGSISPSSGPAVKFSLIDPTFNYTLHNGGNISGSANASTITAANLQASPQAKISIINGYTYPRSLDSIAPPNFGFPPDTAAPEYSGTITAKTGQIAINFADSNVGLELTQNKGNITGTIYGSTSEDVLNINGGTINRVNGWVETINLGAGKKTINIKSGLITGLASEAEHNALINNATAANFDGTCAVQGLATKDSDVITFNISEGVVSSVVESGRGTININGGVAPVLFNISGGSIINFKSATGELGKSINIQDIPAGSVTGITTLNITNTPVIKGQITLPAIANVLNIGIKAAPGITEKPANFSTGGNIVNAQIINVNKTTGDGFTINRDITGVKTFTVNALTNTVIAGGKTSGIDTSAVLSNAGNVTMKQTGSLDIPFKFSNTNGALLTLEGGSILKPVTGNLEVDNTIKVTGNFATSNTIDKVGIIEVAGIGDNVGVFEIKNSITNVDTRFDNKSNGMIIVDNGGNVSGKATLINSGVLTLNNGGIVNMPVSFGNNGGVINIAGGTINSLVTGNNKNNEIINILGDCTTSGSLSKIQNVGNLLVDTKNFTINSQLKGISYNFGNSYHSTTNIVSGGDVSGGGAISNAGIIAVNGGTIGSDARMGNVINSGTIDIAGNVNVRAFTNGISHPAGSGPLTAINTVNIVFNSTGDSGGSLSDATNLPLSLDQPPTVVRPNTVYIQRTGVDPIPPVNINNINIADPDSTDTVKETIILMANNGVLKLSSSYVKPADVTIFGQNTATITAIGKLNQLQIALNNLEFVSTLSTKYGFGSVTVVMNDNDNQSGVNNAGMISSDIGANTAGILNITSGNVVTENVTNELGAINISGGDLSSFLVNANNITNKPSQTITVSDSGKVGNTRSFNKILNYGILKVDGEGATIKASAIELYKDIHDTNPNSGVMTTSGTINAPINFKDGNVTLNIRGGAINEVITGSTNNADTSNINILGTFVTKKSITNVKNINVTKDDNGVGNLTVNHAITGVDTKFYTNEGTITKINQNATQTGSISGLGAIENNGTLTLAGDAITNGNILGSFSTPMGNVTNKGVFNVGAGKAYVGNFTNNSNTALLNITGGTLQTKNINNTLGKITISGGDLSGIDNTISLTNALNQTIEILDKGSLGANLKFANINNSGIINLATNKMFATNLSNNTDGIININNNGILNNDLVGNLVNSGLINLNPGGTISMPVIFGSQGGVVNFAGGSATRIIGGTGNVNGKGIAKISVDLAYDGVHNPIISNIAAINVANGNFSVNGLINGLNEYFSIDKDAVTTINQNGNISGNNIYLQNSGTLTVNSGGAINIPIRFGTDGGVLNLAGGSVNATIGGVASSGKGTINLNGDFTYNDVSPNISNIANFNVNAGKFNINDSITKINTAFSVANNATIFINSKGSLSGDGEIYNSGTINLDGGTIGTELDPISGIVNTGTINVNNKIYIKNNIQNNNGATGQASGALVTTTGIYAISNQATTPADKLNLGHIIINNNGKIFGTVSSAIYNSGEITLNTGGEINTPINFGDSNSGILNLVGGSVLANITGNHTGTINVNKNFTYDGARSITNVNTINVNSPFKFLVTNSTVGSDTFNNTGTIKLTGGTIAATQINHDAGYLIINEGTINSAINVRADLAAVTINGGAVNGNITGYDGGNTVININNKFNNFTTGGTISKINVININQNTFNVNHALSDNGSLNTLYETTAQINTGGSISGSGYINNLGTVKLAGGTSSVNKIYNNGIFIVDANGKILDGNFINSKFLSSTNNSSNSAIDPFTVYGNIDINVTQTALSVNLNDQSLTKSIPGTQTVTQNNNITFSSATKNAIVIDGIDRNGGTLKLIATHGTLTVPNVAELTGISGNNSGIVYLSGSLDKLNNSLQGLVFSPELNYVGSGAKLQIIVHNNRLTTSEEIIDNDQFIASTPNIPESYIPVLNIKSGGSARPASIENNFGKIDISGGDLSSVSNSKASTLLNAAGQTITVSGTGTIGADQALGTVTNNGIINAGGGTIKITEFINNNINAALNITNSLMRITEFTNYLGTVNVSGGMLVGLDSMNSNSNITNYSNINISQIGSIGTYIDPNSQSIPLDSRIGTITNRGIITVDDSSNILANKIDNYNVINLNGGAIGGNNFNNFGIVNVTGGSRIGFSINNNNLININSNAEENFLCFGNINNNVNALINISANLTMKTNTSNTITNNGIVYVSSPIILTDASYIVSNTGVHLVTINNNNNNNNNILTLQNSTVNFNPNSTIKLNHSDDYLIKDNDRYTIITANPGSNIILDSSNVKVTGSTELISYTANKVGNNVEVIAKRNLIEGVVKTSGNLGATPLAKVLDNLVNTGVTGDLRTALIKLDGLLTEQEVNDAVNQLMPETNITPEVSFTPPAMVFSTVTERFDLIARAGIANIKTGYSAGSMQSSNNLWLKGFGGLIDQKQRTIFPGYKANSLGFAFGLDDQVLNNTWLGVGFSSVNTHINGQDGSSRKTKVTSRQVTFYGSYSPEDYYIDAFIATAFNNYKISRGIKYNGLNYTATADYNAIQPSAKVSSGIIWDFYNDFKLIPNLSLQYSVLKYNAYNETGAGGLSLQKVTSKNLEQLEGGIGIKFSWLQKENEQIYNPYLHLTMLHDFKSSAQVTTAQFLGGGGTFTIQGAPYDKKTYNIGAGITIVNQNRLNCTINYDLKKKNKFIGHTGYVAVKYAF